MSKDKLVFEYKDEGLKADFILSDPKMTSVRVVLSQNWKSLDPTAYTQKVLQLHSAVIEWHKHTHPDTYVYYAGIQYAVTYEG